MAPRELLHSRRDVITVVRGDVAPARAVWVAEDGVLVVAMDARGDEVGRLVARTLSAVERTA